MENASVLLIGAGKNLSTEILPVFREAGIHAVQVVDCVSAMMLAKRHAFHALVLDSTPPEEELLETISMYQQGNRVVPVLYFSDHDALRDLISDYVYAGCFHTVPAELGVRGMIREIEYHLSNSTSVSKGTPSKTEANITRGFLKQQKQELPSLVGKSQAICDVRQLIAEVADSDMTVLIEGETGTGKSVVAQLIHELSLRSTTGSFITICCPAIPDSLLESEFFGHEVGAFTGADRRKPGRLELGIDGTVLLDEIGDIPQMIQAKLLQVLEEKQFVRIGGTEYIQVNTRLIAATNAGLEQLCREGKFRSDLFYRLNQFHIHLPPLRDRVEDIPLLIGHFLEEYGPKYGHSDLKIENALMGKLLHYSWPGNIRELESVMRRYALTGHIDATDIAHGVIRAENNHHPDHALSYREQEKCLIVEALQQAHWNRRRAAESLGMSYNTLRRRIERYNLNQD